MNVTKRCREIIIEHLIFWPIFSLYALSVWYGTTNFGGWAASAVGLIALGIIGAYGEKLRRYHAKVRFRQGCLQRTGDGGEDCWTVLLRKRWANFLTHPFTHVFKPAPGLEQKVDCAGEFPGSVRMREKPMRVIAQHEKYIDAIGHADVAPSSTRKLLDDLLLKAKREGINIADYADLYFEDLVERRKQKRIDGVLEEEEFYQLLGLHILERDGLSFVLPVEEAGELIACTSESFECTCDNLTEERLVRVERLQQEHAQRIIMDFSNIFKQQAELLDIGSRLTEWEKKRPVALAKIRTRVSALEELIREYTSPAAQ